MCKTISGFDCPDSERGVTKLSLEPDEIDSMKPDPRIFDDISRVAGGALNVFSGLREQLLNDIKARFEEMATRMDLVPREDFDRLEAQVKELQKQVTTLSGKKPAAAPKASTKAAPKKAPAKKTAKKTGKKK
jgi:BMFP domain-containing protein YqiC